MNNPSQPTHDGSADHPQRENVEREYLFSVTEEERRKAFEEEDARWATQEQVKDWLKLAVLVILTLTWNLIVYFFSPGLR